jgi:hypothetical protein
MTDHILIPRATLQAIGAQMKWAVPHLPVHTDAYFESMAAVSAALAAPCEPVGVYWPSGVPEKFMRERIYLGAPDAIDLRNKGVPVYAPKEPTT